MTSALRRLRWVALFALTAVATAWADADPQLIIVSFVDRGINAAPVAAPGDFYVPGPAGDAGGYASTPWSRRLSASLARDYALEIVTGWPIRALGVHCVVYRVASASSVDATMQRLAADARVTGVQRMNSFRVLNSPPGPAAYSPSLIELDAAHRLSTGRNVRVAVIDTGIDVHHPNLAGQVVERRDLVDDSQSDHDDVHGTAVAGVIAAVAGNGVGIVGVAPGAKLLSLRACWPEGADDPGAVCNTLTLARALDAAVRLAPDVLNLSLVGPADPLLTALLQAAMDAGVVVVAAAPGPQIMDSFPTAVPRVIEVSVAHDATTTLADDERAVQAPGTEILTTFPQGRYDFISGSSFAAAHVSGVIALLLELHPRMPAAELERLLRRRPGRAAARDAQARDGQTGFRAASDDRLCLLMRHLGHRGDCAASAAGTSAPQDEQVEREREAHRHPA